MRIWEDSAGADIRLKSDLRGIEIQLIQDGLGYVLG